MNRTCRVWLLLAVLASCGNGPFRPAVQPPSPARDLSLESLLALPKKEHEHYYVLIFGSQLPVRIPRYTHSWFVMVRTTEVPGRAPQIADVQTISWMPATFKIRPFCFRVEEGVNLELHTTLDDVLKHRERVSLWGPYETWQGFYVRFTTQRAFLDSGDIGYQCTDGFGEAKRRGNGSNCFHALSDMDPQFDRRQYPLISYGTPASKNIVRQIHTRPILIQPNQTHDWLIPALGLDQYPIIRRNYSEPGQEFSPEAILEAIGNPTVPRR